VAALSGSGPADPVSCRDCEPSYQERRLVCNPLPSLPWITFPREAELAQFAASEERRSCAILRPLRPCPIEDWTFYDASSARQIA
jgi:hypothetical protein